MKLKNYSFYGCYGLLLIVVEGSIATCNAYKLGKNWRFNVSYRRKHIDFDTWEDAKEYFLNIEKMEKLENV